MAFKIVEENCTGCCACEPECPNQAISETANGLFIIEPAKCTECIGHHDEPQCLAVCPIDLTCIIDDDYPRYQAA